MDRIGESVEAASCEGGLLVLNSQDFPPTFCSDMGHNTWIDVSAASPALVTRVVDWAVREDVEILSDHQMIVTQLLSQSRRPEVRVTRDWCRGRSGTSSMRCCGEHWAKASSTDL